VHRISVNRNAVIQLLLARLLADGINYMERRLQLILARRTLMLRGVHKFLRLSPKVLQVELTLTYTDDGSAYV